MRVIEMSNILENMEWEGKEHEFMIGFIQYVYGELQMEGWKTRRHQLIDECNLTLENKFDFDFPDDLTIWKMLNNVEDIDHVISSFFFPIFSQEWMTAWMIRFHTDLPQSYHCEMWNALCEFIYDWGDDTDKFDIVKKILDLEIYLK